jgi:hypothetical protein
MSEAVEVHKAVPLFVPGTGTTLKQWKISTQTSAVLIKDPHSLGNTKYLFVMAVYSGKQVLGFVTAEHSAIADMLLASAGMTDSPEEGPMLRTYMNGVAASHGDSPDYKSAEGFERAAVKLWGELVPVSNSEKLSANNEQDLGCNAQEGGEFNSQWSWGAFLVTTLWCLFSGLWWVPIVFWPAYIALMFSGSDLAVKIAIGSWILWKVGMAVYGRRWAWRTGKWKTVEEFQVYETNWLRIGIGLVLLSLLFGGLKAVSTMSNSGGWSSLPKITGLNSSEDEPSAQSLGTARSNTDLLKNAENKNNESRNAFRLLTKNIFSEGRENVVTLETFSENAIGVEKWLNAMSPHLKARMKDAADIEEFLLATLYESKREGLDPGLVLSLIESVSGFDGQLVTEKRTLGYMQLKLGYVEELGGTGPDVLQSKRVNLRLGCGLMRHYLDEAKGNIFTAALQYHTASLGLSRDEAYIATEKMIRAYQEKWSWNF